MPARFQSSDRSRARRGLCPRATALVVLAALGLAPLLARAQKNPAVAALYRESYKLEAQRDSKGALQRMERIRQLAGRTYFVSVRTGWLSYLAGDARAAAAAYRAAIELQPAAVEPRLGLTLALLSLRSWGELARACRELLVLDPKHAVARARLAHAQYSQGNYPDAVSVYRRLVADYPAELDHQTGLGWALLKLGRADEARKLFEGVLEVSPDNSNAQSGLGIK